LEVFALRRWFARVLAVLFAVSYSAAALAAHCQAHMPSLAPEPVAHHDMGHASHVHGAPAQDDDGCASMVWEKMLGPSPAVSAPSPSAADLAILPVDIQTQFASRAQSYDQTAPRAPPDHGKGAYASHFMRTGRLLI
jgi:hypothetical protein